MPCVSKVAIIGGGIAGLSASVGLARLGVVCHVYENGNPKEGASIGFSGRAAEALEELCLYEPILKAGRAFSSDTRASTMRDSEGKVLSAGPKRPSWLGMKDTVVIYRPMMIDVMTKAAKDLGVQVINGVAFTDIQTRVDGVTIRFTDGSQADYDLVIGADGIGSATRQAMFPDSPNPQYTGQWSIRWMAPGEHIDGESWYNSSAGRFGFYSLPGGHIYVASILDIADDERMSDGEARERFTKLLDSCTAPAVIELRSRLTEDSTLIARPFRWILVDQPWHRGRVLLIGDAAHATTAHMGMGGGMAVEDASVLAQCVGNASTWEEVFGRFMQRRFERVKTVVEGSLALSKLTQTAAPLAERMSALSKAWEAVSDPY